MSEARISIADFLLIAEAVLNVPAEQIARAARLPEAESALAAPWMSFDGIPFYPEPSAAESSARA